MISSVGVTKSLKHLLCVGISGLTVPKTLSKTSLIDLINRIPTVILSRRLPGLKTASVAIPRPPSSRFTTNLKSIRGYDRHPCSLFRILRKLGFFKVKKTKKNSYKPKPYNTPTQLGIKWQMDVKYVPKGCYTGTLLDKFYQYTMIDEASRERFIFPFKEQSSHSTVQFVKMAIKHFRYQPEIIQTDNGFEFTHFRETDKVHPLDILCQQIGIEHKCIRPRTPRHNGKVERSHRNDNMRFYQHLQFYSYDDLIKQMERYLYKSNRLPMQTLDWLSPIETRKKLEAASSF